MKGQSEIMIFVLLLAIGLMIFMIAIFWGWGIFQQNMDMAKVAAAENFMRKLNDEILSSIKYGGSRSFDYNLDGTIELVFYDSDILCLENGYILELLGDAGRVTLGSSCGPSVTEGGGSYFVEGGTGIIRVKTPSLPEEGDYTLAFDENRGTWYQDYENFSVGCGGKIYNYIDDANPPQRWRWKSVTCHFNQGVNEFNYTSTGEDSIWFDSFRISATISYIIEFKTPINLELSREWVNLTPTNIDFENTDVKTLPSIREILDGNLFRIQLSYSSMEYYLGEEQIGKLKIELFTEGPRVAKPDIIKIEKNSTYISDENDVTIKIKITFI